jgi:hypothetical protein
VTIEDGNQNTAGLTLGLRQLRETEVYPLLPEGNGVYKLPAADPGIPAGTYVVTVAPVLTLVPPRVSAPERPAAFRNMYVKSVRFGDVDGLREGVRLESEPQVPIEVVLGTNPGGVKGRVLNEQKEPAAAAFVALVPEGGRRYRSKYEFTSSDASGNFDLSNVPPGDYKLFAWEVAERMDLDDPLFMRRYESLGTPVHIEEGGKVVLDATVIPL